MKNVFYAALVSSAVLAGTSLAYAEPVNKAALAPTQITAVKDIAALADDTKVRLKGQIIRSIGDEKYEFRDTSGVITVDIDDELWKGRPITSKLPVTLVGEVDIDLLPKKRVQIDVDEVIF